MEVGINKYAFIHLQRLKIEGPNSNEIHLKKDRELVTKKLRDKVLNILNIKLNLKYNKLLGSSSSYLHFRSSKVSPPKSSTKRLFLLRNKEGDGS